jgi:hypothetical protein
MEGSCSTGQSPQRAVVPVEEEEEEEFLHTRFRKVTLYIDIYKAKFYLELLHSLFS